MEKYQIPIALIPFLKTIKLSCKETQHDQKTFYKELAVVIDTDNQLAGFLVTEGSFHGDSALKETKNHPKVYWYFAAFETARAFVYNA